MTASGRKTSTPPTTIDGTKRRPRRFGCTVNVLGWPVLNRNSSLYLVIGALVVVVIGLGAYVFHEESKPEGIEMSIGKNGVSIEEN
jgi:hypothetical protein